MRINTKEIMFLMLLMGMIGIASASLGVFKQGSCVEIRTILNTSDAVIATITYPNSITPTCSVLTGVGTALLTVNGTTITSEDPIVLGVGTWTFNCSLAESQNYTAGENITTFEITQNDTYVLSLAITPSTNEDYGTETTATGSDCPAELTCNLYNNETGELTNGAGYTFGAGIYNITYNTTGNANYSSASVSDILTINKISPTINLTLNGTQGNVTILQNSEIYLNVTQITGDSGATLQLFNEGNLINEGVSSIFNLTLFDTIGTFNITGFYLESQNYTEISETWFVKVNTADTCTCAGNGNNWEINMGDACNIETTCYLGTGNITFIGTGKTTFNAAISAKNLEYPTTDQTLMIGSNAIITIG